MAKKIENTCILVVDDSPNSLKFLTDILEETGAVVLVALNGQKALEVIDEVTPDVILMDAVMPGMDGFETCRRIKQSSDMQHVPVIFMTGLSETQHIVEGFQAGGVDYLVKPIASDELIARMNVHLANARLTQGAYLAMDEARRFLFAANRDGVVLWTTPQAATLVEQCVDRDTNKTLQLPEHVNRWLDEQLKAEFLAPSQLMLRNSDKHQLLLSYIGQSGPNEYLLRIIENDFPSIHQRFVKIFGITVREAEVLTWIANGKSNSDIGAILDLSPRTINKHLERIFRKLSVENRTAAAAMALNAL